MKRRAFLGTLGAGALAGCLELPGSSDTDTRTRSPQPFHSPAEPLDWPAPHYDSGHTRHAPDREVLGTNERWHHPVPLSDDPASTLVAADGQVYYALKRRTTKEENRATRLVALDTDTGQVRWQNEFRNWSGGFEPPYGPLPVVYGEMIAFGPESATPRIRSHAAATGDKQWSTPSHGGQRLLVPGAGLLHVLRGNPDRETPSRTVAAVDPLSGADVWTHEFESGVPRYPSFDGEFLYYPLSGPSEDAQDELVVMDPDAGTVERRFQRDIQPLAPVSRGRIFAAQWGGQRIVAVDVETGAIEWENPVKFHHELESGDPEVVNARYRFGGVTPDRLVIHKHLHGSRSDEIWGYDPSTGQEDWRVEPDPEAPVMLFNQPIVVGEIVYVTGTSAPQSTSREGFLHRYDAASGDRLSQRSLPSPCFRPPIVAGDQLFVVAWDGVHAFG